MTLGTIFTGLVTIMNHPANDILNQAIQSQKQGDFIKAEKLFLETIELLPENALVYGYYANFLKKIGRKNEALEYFKKAIKIDPGNYIFYYQSGLIFQENGDLKSADIFYSKAMNLNPSDPLLLNDYAFLKEDMNDFLSAEKYYKKAIELFPYYEKSYNNLSILLKETGKINEAIYYAEQSIKIKPDYAIGHFNLASLLLLNGDYENGFREYEWRFKATGKINPVMNKPFWKGQDIYNKTLLIHAEQGMGDTIQFCRYISLIDKKNAKIVFSCHPELTELLKDLKGLDEIIPEKVYKEPLVNYDFQIPLLSLPYIFKTNINSIPANTPYIFAKPEYIKKWKEQLDKFNKFKIGFVWKTGNSDPMFEKKSCNIDFFYKLSQEFSHITFFSIQKGTNTKDFYKYGETNNFINLSEKIDSFDDTAGIIHNLDLIISVDTSVAHLAGAMGKKVWNLLSAFHDWRWLIERNDSPWYPEMKIFRQKERFTWDDIFNQIVSKIKIDFKIK